MRSTDALCALEDRLTIAGAMLRVGCHEGGLSQVFRGLTALAMPAAGEGGDEAGVREPRVTPPTAPPGAIGLPIPGPSVS